MRSLDVMLEHMEERRAQQPDASLSYQPPPPPAPGLAGSGTQPSSPQEYIPLKPLSNARPIYGESRTPWETL